MASLTGIEEKLTDYSDLLVSFDSSLKNFIVEKSERNSLIIGLSGQSDGFTANSALFLDDINNFLDANIKILGYNSIENAFCFLNSGITSWREEAEIIRDWYDNFMYLSNQEIQDYRSNGGTAPNISNFLNRNDVLSLYDYGLTSPVRGIDDLMIYTFNSY